MPARGRTAPGPFETCPITDAPASYSLTGAAYPRPRTPFAAASYPETACLSCLRRCASSLRKGRSISTLKVLPSSVITNAERKRERDRLQTDLPIRCCRAVSWERQS